MINAFVSRAYMHRSICMLVVGGLLALATLTGCGTKSSTPAEKADAELLSLVSAAISSEGESAKDAVDYGDFAFARRQLGLAADADIYDGPSSDGDAQLSSLRGTLLYASGPNSPPLVRAIDGKSIQAVASRPVVGESAFLAVRTTQSFSEIAVALNRDGYVRRHDLLVSPRGISDVVFPVVADAGGGVVVLGGSESFVRGVLADRDTSLSRAAELISSVPGPARTAHATASKCVLARAAGQNLSPRDGEYVLQVDGTAGEEKLSVTDRTIPTGNGEIVFGDVKAAGDTARIEFTFSELLNPVISQLPDGVAAYDC
ncbi:MAG: hypothetical protein WBK99_00160 [Solirubrobacterales bacterium]